MINQRVTGTAEPVDHQTQLGLELLCVAMNIMQYVNNNQIDYRYSNSIFNL